MEKNKTNLFNEEPNFQNGMCTSEISMRSNVHKRNAKFWAQFRVKNVPFSAGHHEGSWDWAYEMFKLCMNLKNGQNLLFTLPNGQITRRYLILSDEEIERFEKRQLNTIKRGFTNVINELRDTFKIEEKLEYSGEDTSVHCKLRDCSPITQTLQEITQVLPEERRHQVLELIQRARNEKQRANRGRKSGTQNEIYRLIAESYYSPSSYSEDDTRSSEASYAKNGNAISLFDDDQSSVVTSSGTCSSSFSDRRHKDSAYVLCNPSVYCDTPATCFQHENNMNCRSPSVFPN